jgi:hypothetical protein
MVANRTERSLTNCVLRGSGDVSDLYCNDPANGGAFSWFGGVATAVNNASLRYSGDLVAVCAPKGATFSITLSDTPNDPRPNVRGGISIIRSTCRATRQPRPRPSLSRASRRPDRRRLSGLCGSARRPQPPIEVQGRTIVVVRGAPKRPAITINDDARAAMIVDRIRARCPELTSADLLLVARVLADRQRTKDGAPKKAAAKRPAPAKKRARQDWRGSGRTS